MKNPLMLAALHESGHAVAALEYLGGVALLELDRKTCNGKCHAIQNTNSLPIFAKRRCALIFSLAGPLAEAHFTDTPCSLSNPANAGDAEKIRRIRSMDLLEFGSLDGWETTFHEAYKTARDCVERNAHAVAKIALTLFESGTGFLDGEKVESIWTEINNRRSVTCYEQAAARDAEQRAKAERDMKARDAETQELVASHPRWATQDLAAATRNYQPHWRDVYWLK